MLFEYNNTMRNLYNVGTVEGIQLFASEQKLNNNNRIPVPVARIDEQQSDSMQIDKMSFF